MREERRQDGMRAGVTRDVGWPVAIATHEVAVGRQVQRNEEKGVMPIPNEICVLLKTFVVVCICGLCVMVCILIYLINHERNGM